jgi:hypothetical protein
MLWLQLYTIGVINEGRANAVRLVEIEADAIIVGGEP